MSVRVKITFTCDRCGVKAIEYSGSQCSGDAVTWPEGWSRLRFPFGDTAHYCACCTGLREELEVDSMRLCSIWAGRDFWVISREGL